MPKPIRLTRDADGAPAFAWAHDPFVAPADDAAVDPGACDLLLSFTRFQADGDALGGDGRRVGVRLRPDEPVEGLAYDLPRLALVALEFPKFRDGRPLSSAALLRTRYGYSGEVRAVGEVLRDLAKDMVRVGFDAFEPADGSTPEVWAAAALRFRHVYQAAADGRPAGWVERGRRERAGGG